MTIKNISKFTDELIKEVHDHLIEKRADERMENVPHIRSENGEDSNGSSKVANKKVHVDIAETMRKAANEIRSVQDPYKLTYADIFNYANRFKNGK